MLRLVALLSLFSLPCVSLPSIFRFFTGLRPFEFVALDLDSLLRLWCDKYEERSPIFSEFTTVLL